MPDTHGRGDGAALRILVIAFQVGRHADGGVESLTQLLERYAGLDITVLTQGETAKNRRWREAGIDVRVWPMRSRVGGGGRGGLGRLREHASWNVRVGRLARAIRADVVHINDSHALWHSVFGLRLMGVPIVFNIRDTKPGFSPLEIWKWRAAFALTQAQVVLSREMRDAWRGALGVAGRTLHAIHSNVDFQRMSPRSAEERRAARLRLGLPPDRLAAGYVASFSEKKAQLRFITEAGPALARQIPGLQVWFLGDFAPATDPYAAACARAAEAAPCRGQLVFKGYAERMEEWYAALDLVIVATRNEGLARCMIESLACGTPVVSFDVCSAGEILHQGPCGAVVPQGDYAGLVDALHDLARDGEKRLAWGRRGAEVAAAMFEPVRNTARYVGLYRLISGRGGVL
jgi:glycosyltransferase involved in cell wall biosynthesis